MAALSNEKLRTLRAAGFVFSVLFCISNGRDSLADAGLVKRQRVQIERWNSFQTHSERSVSSERWRSREDDNRLAHVTPVEVYFSVRVECFILHVGFGSWFTIKATHPSRPWQNTASPSRRERVSLHASVSDRCCLDEMMSTLFLMWNLQLEEETLLLCVYTVTTKNIHCIR